MDNLLFKLSDFFMEENDEVIIPQNVEKLLGDICLNRMSGVGYLNVRKCKGLKVPKEFIWTLESAYKYNIYKYHLLLRDLEILTKVFSQSTFNYAFLKGAYLSTMIYPKGCRISNDIDLLVHEKNLSECTHLLLDAGFVQGEYKRDKGIQPATRREIIMRRMNYGEIVPFFKVIDDEVIMVDVNFSLDYKPDVSDSVKKMLERTQEVVSPIGKFVTLDKADFVIHLCCHLYKEATTIDWVRTRRDLLLYKFSDLYVIFTLNYREIDFICLRDRIFEYGLAKECYFAMKNTKVLFERLSYNENFVKLINEIKPDDLKYMKQIVCPKEKKMLYYDIEFEEWFIKEDRMAYLKEE